MVKAVKDATPSKYYPADDAPVPRAIRRKVRPTKLRPSITPGTVLILLAGKNKGKRVVFLRQLPSGLLLVTGPRCFNGVKLKRVNQAYVIATSTKIDVSGVEADKFDDAFFKKFNSKKNAKKNAVKSEKKKEDDVEKQQALKEAKKEAQQAVDKVLVDVIKKGEPELAQYISARFSLKHGMKPHELVF